MSTPRLSTRQFSYTTFFASNRLHHPQARPTLIGLLSTIAILHSSHHTLKYIRYHCTRNEQAFRKVKKKMRVVQEVEHCGTRLAFFLR